MSTYTDVFGNDTIPPSGLGYASFAITTDTTFVWPYNTDGSQYPIAKVMDVSCAAGNAITLPDAREVSAGEDFLIRNVGSNLLAVKDAAGVQIASVATGAASYFYLTDNTTAAGVYGVIGFGIGTSTVDAASLVGYGIKAIGASLNQSHPVFPTATSITIDDSYRAKLIVFTGGADTFPLTSAATLGDDYFTLFRNEGTGTVTIDPASGELIDGMSTMQVQPGESLMLICTGTQWYSVGYGRSVLYQFTQLTKDVSAGGTITLTAAEAANKLMTFIGNPSGAVNVVVPSIVAVYYTQSSISTAETITFKTAAGSGVGISQGARIIALCDGTNVVSAQSAVANASVSLTDGSSSVPSLFFATQTNTGLYKSGTQDLGVTVNGSAVGVFGSTGLQSATIGANSTQRHTVPAVSSDTVTLNAATQTLTNKTISVDNNTVSGIAASSFVLSNASGNIDGAASQKVIPAGAVVGTTDIQTLTNKTISVDDNTVSGIAASSFVLSNASGNIDGTAAQKVIPAGAVVGTTDIQTLTNKTLSTGSTWQGNTVAVAYGGTGLTTIAALSIPVANILNTYTSVTASAGQSVRVNAGGTAWETYTPDVGTVTSVSVSSANGFAGTVANATTTPAITLSTSVTGVLKGNGTAISAATAGTDYLAPPSGTAILKANSGGALANAVAGTDYLSPPSGTAILKANSGGALANATAGTDYVAPVGSDGQVSRQMFLDCGYTVVDKGNINNATVTFDYTGGSIQTYTATGSTVTWAFSNWPPTGNLGEFLIIATNAGEFTHSISGITWIKPNGTTTTSLATYLAALTGRTALQSSGTDQFYLWSRDAGTTVYGKLI